MKKIALILFIVISALLFYACNNTFDPNAPFRERYVLSGIMRNDTSLQIVTLSKSYQPGDGYNPFTNTKDPAVIGAQVNLWYRDTLYPMRDTTIVRQDTSRYEDSVHCYYVNNLMPQQNEYVEIQAVMPNGILLKSSTKLPEVDPGSFFNKFDDKSVPPPDPSKNDITVEWASMPNTIYLPRIYITYYVKNSSVKKEWPVPLFYDTENGKQVPIYPTQTKTNFVSISMATITQALNEIPQGDYKKNFSIGGFDVEVTVYDPYLSTYYFSLQTGADSYTVRLDAPDFSNVQGGYGIFCSYAKTDYHIRFTYDYLLAQGFE